MEFDVTLINRMKKGEQDAYSSCYRKLSPAIYSSVLRICHCKSAAQDIVQETFIQVFKSINTLKDGTKFIPWCKRIGYHKTISWLRTNSGNILSFDLDDAHELIDTSDLQIELENSHQLTKLMLSITPQSRLILWLFIVEGYSHTEIAVLFGKSPSFSKSIISRSLSTLNLVSQEKQYVHR